MTGTSGVLGDISLANDSEGLVRLRSQGVDWHLDRSWWPWPGGWGTPRAASGRLHGLPVRVWLGQDRHMRSCYLEGPWPAALEDRSSGNGWCATGPHWQRLLDGWRKLRKEEELESRSSQIEDWGAKAAGSQNAGSWHARRWWGSWLLSPPSSWQRMLLKWLTEPPQGSRWFQWQPTRWQAMVQAPVDAGYPLLWIDATSAVARSLFAQLGGEVRFGAPSTPSAASYPEGSERAEGWKCPICGLADWPTADAGPPQACDRCGTLAHRSCREFLGRCSLFGCEGSPKP